MRFIGDIHGDIHKYNSIINGCTESVQIGDFGIGFLTPEEEAFVDSLHADGRHKFIRGNHDDPARCKLRHGYIEDGTFDAERSIMYVGGAWSIDWQWRTKGYSWWEDEELSDAELKKACELFVQRKPKIMVTHDAPTSAVYQMYIAPTGKHQYRTRTADAFEKMFRLHQPDIWIFGHWHVPMDEVIDGTRFICLDIDAHIDLEV